jgi:RNA polymerase sigma-54 factor
MGAMEIRQEQSLKLLQKLVLTPQLQLAIRLLQLSRLELAEEIRQQLDGNPMLEEEGLGEETLSYQDPVRDDPTAAETAPEAPAPTAAAEAEDRADGGEADATREVPSSPEDVQDWERFVDDYNRFSSGPQVRVSNEEYPSIESTVCSKGTLTDHLLWQLQLADLTDEQREIGAFLIGNLDDDGYLKDVTEDEIAAKTGSEEATVRAVLVRIQAFDPVGVGARDLRECLLIQARTHHPDNDRLRILLERHLPDLERKNFPAIARGLKCSLDEVKDLVETITRMDPKPGRAFSSEDVIYIQPDVYVFKMGGDYVTVLNEDGLPKLKISPYYEAALTGRGGDAKDFVQDKLRSAMWLIRSIHQRQSTIRKVTESIMRFQRDFLEKGVTHLRPLVLRDVAEDVGMHESTISRVTTNKYVHTPRGIFELKYFFNSRIGSVYGEDQSSESVKSHIKSLVDVEDPRNPLSDQELVEKLRRENVVIARRTVAKYREALGILPSSRRRALV